VQPILEVEGLNKTFSGAAALRDVSFTLGGGEIRAICGENGAGKSTFVKILMGIVRPDSGTVIVGGEPRTFSGSQDAQALGLGLVAQELSLAPHLSILDNIWLGSAEVPFFHRRAGLRARARHALEILGVGDWDLDAPVSGLSIAHRQIVEIARLFARDARVLILDEPSATLSDAETERMHRVLKTLKAQGRSVIYISHRLGEIFTLCDSVTVLRNGEHIRTAPVADIDHAGLIALMLGRPIEEMYPAPRAGETAAQGLTVRNLHIPGAVAGCSFTAPRGRILAIAGQIGSGAATVTRALAGLVHDATGEVTVDGEPLPLGAATTCVARGVLFVSEDRAEEGLFREMTVLDNLVATRIINGGLTGMLSWPRLRELGRRLAQSVRVDPQRLGAHALALSGGNQQKLLFGRAIQGERAGVLLMNEPTRGIDVGARAEIYQLMRELCDAGYALVMTSSDLEEVVGLSDIVVTMYRGRAVAQYERGGIDMAAILADITHPVTAPRAAA
jgi:ribose transport system ATP-binding protein/rhamnose transport system ATP-binding protein